MHIIDIKPPITEKPVNDESHVGNGEKAKRLSNHVFSATFALSMMGIAYYNPSTTVRVLTFTATAVYSGLTYTDKG